ncbi:MAG: hypothetical protein P0Y60_00125 [Candidatus Microbacterium colombiense]|nr:MAG: hypothetical protein P0Y60_00125 [Microbacterium sp.]
MRASPGVLWLTLRLPPSDADQTDELAGFLLHLRIPAAVQHRTLLDTGTLALIPYDGLTSLLSVPDEYAPTLTWDRVPIEAVVSALTERFGYGVSLDGEPVGSDVFDVDPVDLDEPLPEFDDEMGDEFDDADDADDAETGVVPTAPLDAIAWTTREDTGVIALVGAHFDMSFDAVDAGERGRALRPHLDADRDRALELGLWAMTDGIAVWRRGQEHAASFVARRNRAHLVTWQRPWVRVDPSKPGQSIDGALVHAWLEEVIPPNGDADAWIARFRLDAVAASRLRALFRREAHANILAELFETLALDPTCLELSEDDLAPDDEPEVIRPRTVRQQFRDGMGGMPDPFNPPVVGFRHRHPRVWLVASLVGVLALVGFAVAGLVAGRLTALVPGLVAAIWAGSLFVDGAVARARGRGRRAEDLPSADPEH